MQIQNTESEIEEAGKGPNVGNNYQHLKSSQVELRQKDRCRVLKGLYTVLPFLEKFPSSFPDGYWYGNSWQGISFRCILWSEKGFSRLEVLRREWFWPTYVEFCGSNWTYHNTASQIWNGLFPRIKVVSRLNLWKFIMAFSSTTIRPAFRRKMYKEELMVVRPRHFRVYSV